MQEYYRQIAIHPHIPTLWEYLCEKCSPVFQIINSSYSRNNRLFIYLGKENELLSLIFGKRKLETLIPLEISFQWKKSKITRNT